MQLPVYRKFIAYVNEHQGKSFNIHEIAKETNIGIPYVSVMLSSMKYNGKVAHHQERKDAPWTFDHEIGVDDLSCKNNKKTKTKTKSPRTVPGREISSLNLRRIEDRIIENVTKEMCKVMFKR